MDRLPTVALALSLLVGCDGEGSSKPPPPAPSRVDAVAAAAPKERPLEEFCEKRDLTDAAPTFAWPELDGATPPQASTWTWVNVWATWCGPCVAEMPMIQKWKPRLAADGHPVEVQYLSVDAKAEDVTKFAASHPEVPTGVRIKDYGQLAGWLGTVGLDASAVIPIHLFLDPSQKIRCVRLGAIEEPDYATVKRVLAGK